MICDIFLHCSGGRNNNSSGWKIDIDNSESLHSFEEPQDGFPFNYYESEEKADECGVTSDDTIKRIISTEKATNDDRNIEERLSNLFGVDKQFQLQICLNRIKSQNTFPKSTKFKPRCGRKTETHENINAQAQEIIKSAEKCEKTKTGTTSQNNNKINDENDDDPEFVPSDSLSSDNKIKQRRQKSHVSTKSNNFASLQLN